MEQVIKNIAGLFIIIGLGATCYYIGVNSYIEPTADYFWIDDNLYQKDSIVTVESVTEGYNIVISSAYGTQEIQCRDYEGYTAGEWKDSFIMGFKEQCR